MTDGLRQLASLGRESFCLLLSKETKEQIEKWDTRKLSYLTGGAKFS